MNIEHGSKIIKVPNFKDNYNGKDCGYCESVRNFLEELHNEKVTEWTLVVDGFTRKDVTPPDCRCRKVNNSLYIRTNASGEPLEKENQPAFGKNIEKCIQISKNQAGIFYLLAKKEFKLDGLSVSNPPDKEERKKVDASIPPDKVFKVFP